MNTLQEVVAALERAQLLVEMPDLHTWPEITGLTADSRKVERGMLYCAVHGSARDGHEFVAAARERGAAAALVEREQGVDVPQILVRDGRRAAAVAAETWYDRPAAKLDLVGVTGTNGKTTSVTLLRHVLSALEPTGSIGTLGAFDPTGEPVPSEAGNLTTPGPIDLQATLAALVARGARGATMEVSSHSLDQGRVDGLVFRAAVFTNLTREHLDYHKTPEEHFRAKAERAGPDRGTPHPRVRRGRRPRSWQARPHGRDRRPARRRRHRHVRQPAHRRPRADPRRAGSRHAGEASPPPQRPS